MKIEQNKFVSLIYKLRLNSADGEMIEETTMENPLQFIYGMGRMIPMFEKHLSNLEEGDSFMFGIEAKDAYGEVNNDYIIDLPKELFKVNGKIDEKMIAVGNTVPMQDDKGNRMIGTVREAVGDKVKMDFNHQLAGQSLFFSGKVLEVRDATEDEISSSCSSDCHSDCGGCHCG